MKDNKKMRIISCVLILCMLFSIMPTAAFATNESTSSVLLWTTGWDASGGNNLSSYGENSFNAVETLLEGADSSLEVVRVTTGSGLNIDLSKYDLVWLHLPQITESNYSDYVGDDTAGLKAYLDEGGRVVIQTELSTMMQAYYSGTTKLAEALGGGFSVSSNNATEDGLVTFNSASKLTDGLNAELFNVNRILSFPVLTLTGNAQPVVQREGILVADQAVSNGRLTIITDINWYMTQNLDTVPNLESDTGKQLVKFFQNLLTDTRANKETVANSGNPNENFGDGTLVTTFDQLEAAIANGGPIRLGAGVAFREKCEIFSHKLQKSLFSKNKKGRLKGF